MRALTKPLAIVSALAAVAVGVSLGAREWPPLIPLTAAAFVIAAAGARFRISATWWAILGTAYISPVMFQATRGEYFPAYQLVWVAAVLGLVLGSPGAWRWSLPARWQAPLAYWALVIALTWPIVTFREADFRWHMFDVYRASTTGIGGPPPIAAIFLSTVALTHLSGILFFDHLFAVIGLDDRRRLQRLVLWPLGISAVLCALVAIYQGAVNLFWLSDHHWPFDGRAAGGLIDGDATGALLGFCCGLPLLLLARWTMARALVAAAGSGVMLAGLWATGSRSALIAGAVSLTIAALAGMRDRAVRRRLVPALVIGVVIAGAGLYAVRGRIKGPIARISTTLEEARSGDWKQFVEDQFFNRGAAVGSASVLMMKQHPIVGVGVGGFYQLFPDYAYFLTGNRQGFDNAQSWYRHLLAELGILGSLGWLWWTFSCARLVWRTRGNGDDLVPAGALKGALWSVAIVSAVAMPTQITSISILVWALAFAYVSYAAPARVMLGSDATSPARTWTVLFLLTIGFAAGTGVSAWRELRVPYRAMFASWSYQRGMYPPEVGPDDTFWWTEQEAVCTGDAKPGYLRLVFWLSNPDLASDPVQVKLWSRDRLIADMLVKDSARIERYVPVPDKAYSMMITSWVSRTWQPSTTPGGDNRALGLAMAEWRFVETPPPGAIILR